MNEVTEIKQAVTPAEMLSMAIEKGADIDQLSKLMDLQERWEAKQSKKSYVEAMARFRAACPSIDKTKKAHNSNYAGLAETLDQIKSLLSENGLSHSWRTRQEESLTTVTCIVTHIDGHSEETSLSAPPDTAGSIKGIQAIASTISYLERYTLFAILGLASKDMDTDGIIPFAKIDNKQLNELNKKLDETKSDKKKFCEIFAINSLVDLPVSRFNEALQAIKAKAKK